MNNYSKELVPFEIEKLTHLIVDPYDGHDWLCLGFTIAYGIGLIGVGFIGSVIWYELSGGTGPYRTLANQLVSWTLIEVCVIMLLLEVLQEKNEFFSAK